MDLERQLEALLFLAPDPVPVEELADALRVEEHEVAAGLRALAAALEGRGIVLRELAGGWTLASHPDAEESARRLLARPRTPGLTPAQAETLSIVGYLQPVSRPEVARIRGVASESATTSLVERGLIEEAGRSQFGAILYRTTPLFLKLFGLKSVDDLPDPAQWDPEPGGAGRAARPPAARGRGARRHADVRVVTARSRAPHCGHAILRRPFRDSGQGRSMLFRPRTLAGAIATLALLAPATAAAHPPKPLAKKTFVTHARGRGAARAHRLCAGHRLGHARAASPPWSRCRSTAATARTSSCSRARSGSRTTSRSGRWDAAAIA